MTSNDVTRWKQLRAVVYRNRFSCTWVAAYMALILVFLPLLYAGLLTHGFTGVNHPPLREFVWTDLLIILWPAIVPAVVFWRRENGQRLFGPWQTVIWGAIPAFVFVLYSLAHAISGWTEGVVRMVLLLMHVCLGWTLMLAWNGTLRMWGTRKE